MCLCDVYGHYSHHCPDLPDFRLALLDLNNPVLETENLTIREILPSYLDPETSQLPIVEIHPPESSASEEFENIYMFSSVTNPSATDLTTHTFYSDEEILEALTAPDYPWDDMHHRSYFLPDEPPSTIAPQFAVESKDFLPPKVDWFKDPIPAPDAFEEGNMANISPVIQVDLAATGGTPELIALGESCTEQEVDEYKTLFKEFRDVFAWSYTETPGLDPAIIEHHIDTWPDVPTVRQKQRPIHL